ncbi:MAG TPA: hypothetical protein VGG56_04575 [Terracidiphilus sp.]|jgi:hypothetical protein
MVSFAQSIADGSTGSQLSTQPSGMAVSVNLPNFQKINGVIQADQYPGADMCVKIQAAEAASSGQMIDATHFQGIQSCSVDPFVKLASNQTIRFGQVTVNSMVSWNLSSIANGVSVIGAGNGQTLFHYIGSSIASFVNITGQPGGSFGDNLEEFSILGNNNATNGLYIYGTHHNLLKHLGCWGFTNCLTSTASILNTWVKPVVSIADAGWLWGYSSPSNYAPHTGLYLSGDNVPGQGIIQSTAATIVDADIENVSGCGIDLVSAATTTITSGTSEGNGTGLCIAAGSNNNTVIGLDMESNTVQDLNDAGNSNHYLDVIAISNGQNAMQFTANASDWKIDGGTITKVLNSAVYPAWVGYQGAKVSCQSGFVCSSSSGIISVTTASSGNVAADLFQGVWAAAAPSPRICTLQEVDSNSVQIGIHQDPTNVSGKFFQAAVRTAASPSTTYKFAYLCQP